MGGIVPPASKLRMSEHGAGVSVVTSYDIGSQLLHLTLSPDTDGNHARRAWTESEAMWSRIRRALLRGQAIVVLALLFLVTDALLATFSPESSVAHPDSLQPASSPSTETFLEAAHGDGVPTASLCRRPAQMPRL
jgi:hypothetical protein